MTLSFQLWRCLLLWLPPPAPIHSGNAYEPDNPGHGKGTWDPGSLPSPPPGGGSGAWAPGHSRSTHQPNVPGSDASSSNALMTPEAQAATTRAMDDTSDRGGGEWKMLMLKYNQKQLR